MATGNPSRNSFAAPGSPSIADLIGQIGADGILSKRDRQNMCWALRTLCRVAGKEPEAVPAHPAYLRRLLKRAAPTAAGLTPAAWNNARSLASKAMARAGITTVPGRYLAAYTDEWAALWASLPAKSALAVRLTRLFHFCSAQRIAPAEMSDAVLRSFYSALVEESLVEDPWAAYRGAAKSWNNAHDRIPGWPPTRLMVPTKRPEAFSLPWAALPGSLRAEIEGYFQRAVRVDLDGDFARPQRPQTVATRRKQLLWLISAVVKSGVPVESLTSLAVLLVSGTVKRGFSYLLERRGGQSYPALSGLAQFLPALARRSGLSAEVIKVLERYKRALKVEQTGMAERHREALRRFNDPAAVRALIAFADRIQAAVAASKRQGERAAKLIQTAVAVDLLLYAPVRIGNLAAIEIDRHLIVVQSNPRVFHLRFPAAETKNAQDLEFPLPPETVTLVELYLARYRPLLTAEPSPFLFPGKRAGCPKTEGALREQIRETVREYTTLEMPPHRFRHAVGKIFLDRAPGQYGVVQRLLGHKRIQTTIVFYAGEEGAAAARHYHETILGLRRGTAAMEVADD